MDRSDDDCDCSLEELDELDDELAAALDLVFFFFRAIVAFGFKFHCFLL